MLVKLRTPEERQKAIEEIDELTQREPEINTEDADRLSELIEAVLTYDGITLNY